MLGILRDSVSVTILSNGFSCQDYPCNPSSYLYRISYRHIGFRSYVNSAIKSNRRCAIMPDPCVISMWRPRAPQMNMLRSLRMCSLRVVVNMVASVDTGLVCEEKEENKLIERGDEGFEESYIGQILPPWGDITIHEDPGIEPSCVSQPESNSNAMKTMDETRVHLLEETDEELLSKRILVLSRTNKVRSSLELFRSMELSGLSPNLHACNSLLSCLLRNELLDDGLRVFEFMKTKKITTCHTYSLVLKAVANARGCDTALEMFMELLGECEVKKDFDAIVYNTMITACGKVNNWVETERIWKSMKANGCCATRVTYCLLVSNFIHSGQNELALDAYSEMVRNGFDPGNDTMQAIISVCTKEGKWNLALSIFQDMLKGGFKPNLIACNAFINSLGKGREVKLAFEVYDITRSLGHSPDSYTWNSLLGALYKADRHDDALHLFESIKRDQGSLLNLHLYNTALMSCSKLGSWDRALQLLWQMEAGGLSVPSASYNLVISACEIARKPEVALQVYEHMVHRKCNPDTFTHLSLLRGCIWGSLWDEVEEILNVSVLEFSITLICLNLKYQFHTAYLY
jgi:pentatricopeptide repeat protein